jgi:hypothetical protein
MFIDEGMCDFSETIVSVDPSGRGSDETVAMCTVLKLMVMSLFVICEPIEMAILMTPSPILFVLVRSTKLQQDSSLNLTSVME